MELKRWALIDIATNIVVNVCDWDGLLETWSPEPGISTVELPENSPVGIDDLYDPTNGLFTRPD